MYTYADNTTTDYFCQHTCEHYKNVTINLLLDQAPCPPAWKTSLFWGHPNVTGLSSYELNYVVKRCRIPVEEAREQCSTLCVILISFGVVFLFSVLLFLAYCYNRARLRYKVKSDSSSDSSSGGSSENGTSSTKGMYSEANGNKPSVRYDHAHDNVAFDKSNDDVSTNKNDVSNKQSLTNDQTEESYYGDVVTDMNGKVTTTDGKP